MSKAGFFFFIAAILVIGQCSSLTGVSGADTVREDGIKENLHVKDTQKEISLSDLMSVSSNRETKWGTNKSFVDDSFKKQDITGLNRVYLKGGEGRLLTQDMISQRLRRYIIEGTFDLGGKKLIMPYGSVLDLEAGELRNGTLVMNQTRVTPIYGISKQHRIRNVKVSGDYYETLVDLWGVSDEPLFPWDTTAPKKVYKVDLKKFGITPGYQRKRSDGHYTDTQYDLMYRNGVGFTNAIRWAYDHGYDGILFPKNDYCFTPRTEPERNNYRCGQVLVQDLDKFDINLGGGSYYNILDSSVKSKYYKADGPSYDQRSYMFWLSCCINVQVHNGRLVGDRKLRDYEEPKERNQEMTYGIMVSGYCYNIRLYHIEVSSFMGCGITTSQSGSFFRGYDAGFSSVGVKYVGNAIPGKYVERDGKIITDKSNIQNCLLSEYIDFSGWYPTNMTVPRKLKEMRVFSVNNNRGYTRIPDMYLNVDVLTFNKNISTEQPLRIIHSSYLEHFQLLEGETGIKFQFYYDDGVGSEGVKHKMAISDVITSDCVIEYCNIHDNHKGGISGGCNRTIIRHCTFSMNDTEKNHAGKTIPLFLVGGTNFQINYEDSYCKSLEICNNTFSRNGNKSIGKILLGALTFSFHDNESDAEVFIYNNLLADIHNNQFKERSFGFSNWMLSTNEDNQSKYGCKYLTRTALGKDNDSSPLNIIDSEYRTLFFVDK